MSNKEISKFYLEENTVRLVAAQVVVVSVIILLTKSRYLALALGADFAVRSFTTWPSPLALMAKWLVRQFKITPVRIFAAPKKFAAAIGFVFALSISLLFFVGWEPAAYLVGAVLIFCAVLEAVFKICVGCYVYDWFVTPFLKSA